MRLGIRGTGRSPVQWRGDAVYSAYNAPRRRRPRRVSPRSCRLRPYARAHRNAYSYARAHRDAYSHARAHRDAYSYARAHRDAYSYARASTRSDPQQFLCVVLEWGCRSRPVEQPWAGQRLRRVDARKRHAPRNRHAQLGLR